MIFFPRVYFGFEIPQNESFIYRATLISNMPSDGFESHIIQRLLVMCTIEITMTSEYKLALVLHDVSGTT